MTEFARSIDVLTFEFENIPAPTIEWAAREQPLVRPRGEVLLIAQNRLREKEFLSGAGFPVAPFRRVASEADLTSAVEAIGRPSILKGAAFGYDGKGQQRIDPGTDLAEIWSARENAECVLEQVIDFEREISVIVARGPDGQDGGLSGLRKYSSPSHPRCHARARRGSRIASRRRRANWPARSRESLDLVGLLAVEMFLRGDGELIINELAPRPHNSGHWTIEGCVTSQFEQHVRAVCGLPLGKTDILRPSAMVNLLGDVWSEGEPDWAGALAEPNVHLHLYGKREPRSRRKMGHLTAVGRDGRSRRGRRATRTRAPAIEMNTQIAATASPNDREAGGRARGRSPARRRSGRAPDRNGLWPRGRRSFRERGGEDFRNQEAPAF